MTNLQKGWAILGLISLLATAACGSSGTSEPRTAYDRACRSVYMKPAAARQAYWCWQSVGANTYEEWRSFETASAAQAGERIARGEASLGVAAR
jgi:hypothetical protein